MSKSLTLIFLALSFNILPLHATIVEFQTSHGNFKVNLHDETTPKTVENFLQYVNSGKYDNTIFHRTVDDFIIQGGGAKFEGTLPPTWIAVEGSITNEPVYSNVKATISMAKQQGKIDSATSQWFINTKNNASVLDPIDIYNGGAYSVFGEVIEDGMDVVNKIAAVERCNTQHAGFKELPMPGYSNYCGDTNAVPSQENFVTIYNIVIFDSTVKTDTDLASIKNTLYSPKVDVPVKASSSGGGGTFTWFSLVILCLITFLKRK